MGERLDLGDVGSFTAGAVGQPGRRTFYVQVRGDDHLLSIKCEKAQVSALAQFLRGLLADLPAPTDRPLVESLDLVEPDRGAFVLGQISVGYDEEVDRIVLLLEEILELDDEGDPLPGALDEQSGVRVRVTRGQALAFAEHADAVVAAGRPACRFCGRPLDPEGHACPRMN